MGLGFSFALLVLGAVREVLGTGMLFSQADLLFGESAKNWQINVFDGYSGMLLALLLISAAPGKG
jgi:electron transport complex protein RnfE